MGQTAVYYHPRFLAHDTGQHPESAERLIVCRRVLLESSLPLEWIEPSPADLAEIERVHTTGYIEEVRALAAHGGGHLDWDTAVSPASFEAAVLAAGAGVQAVDRALDGLGPAFLLVRPPGHHALKRRGMGFCLFNNVAVASTHALAARGLERILIFDWDVHHGNGTQDAFYDDPRVLFVSMHQRDHYPGTGYAEETGTGAGSGYTVNVPLPAGTGDGAVTRIFSQLVEPLARAYRPQLVVVSAGFDSRSGDPLGGFRLSVSAYAWMASRLSALATELGAVGPVFSLEGGYDPHMVAESIVATLGGLSEEAPPLAGSAGPAEEAAVASTLRAVAPFWPGVLD